MGFFTNLCFLSLIVASINSLPIGTKQENYPKIVPPELVEDSENVIVNSATTNSNSTARNTIRPGMTVWSYAVEITPDVNAKTFRGEVLIVVDVAQGTREDDLVFHTEDLTVTSVRLAPMMTANFANANFDVDDGLLSIAIENESSMFTIWVEYTGQMNTIDGLFTGNGAAGTYVAMNLHPTNARRVFPCIDEPNVASAVTFTFNGLDYTHLMANSRLNNTQQFLPILGPAHLWGMVAHSFTNINNPVPNVPLFGRPGVANQDAQVSIAINSVFTFLNEWTDKNYFNVIEDIQDGRMNIIALPDVSNEWYSLSIVGIWEPFVFMTVQHAVSQRKEAFVQIAHAISRQWFGYVLFPENWIHEWVITGLGSYAAYEALRNFQMNIVGTDDQLLDMNTIFVTDVIQESLYHDAYTDAMILEPADSVFDEDIIRSHVYGLVKHKSPAVLHQLRHVLSGPDNDYIHEAAKSLFVSRSMQSVSSFNFLDTINAHWAAENNKQIDDLQEYLEPYLTTNGYAIVNVDVSLRGVILTQERFGFGGTRPTVTYEVPITFTTAVNPNFDNVFPGAILGATVLSLDVSLDEEEDEWIIFNLQGQGYYRVNYGVDLWERLIIALEDPDEREKIHPLNRATLVDDALNLARAGRVSYDIAFRVVLTMEHETEYAVWKAFIRNMNFLRKRLVAAVEDDEDLDPDIYLRMVRRSIIAFEDEVGFSPEWNVNEPAMTSLARGLVMDHACRSNYDPCIAAAVDWFYDPNSNEPAVNPNIPHDLRPAVFCAMARTGDDDVMQALEDRLEEVPNMYERLIILESMACSQDADFINRYLLTTIENDSPYNLEERNRIFVAVAESSFQNANIALRFLTTQTNAIRTSYGGEAKLDALIFAMIENMADADLSDQFARWVTSTNSNLEGSLEAAERASAMIDENLRWNNLLFEEVYEWIDENNANVATISLFLVCLTFMLTMFNH